jgi:hypothetical protein
MTPHELSAENDSLHRLLVDAARTLKLIADGELPPGAGAHCLERIRLNEPLP